MLAIDSTDLGIGATIPTFPKLIPNLQLISCGLSGTLPAQLYRSLPDFTLSGFSALLLDQNKLNGTIPSTFLPGIDFRYISSYSFSVANNRLSGSIPSNLFAGNWSQIATLSVQLDNNLFTGPLTNIFNSSTFGSGMYYFVLTGDNNGFDGAIPNWVILKPKLIYYALRCDYCKLNSLSSHPFAVSSGEQTRIVVSLQNNNISGFATAVFFYIPHPPQSFELRMPNNSLTGLASNAFYFSNWTATASVIIDLGLNQLTGNVPNTAGMFGSSRIYYWIAMNSNPGMSGILPSSFLSSICANATSSTNSEIALVIYSTRLTGFLTLPNYSSSPLTSLTVIANNADFTYISFPNGTSGILSLTIYNNSRLIGALPSAFFQNNPRLVTLYADNTQLNGLMPNMGAVDTRSMETLRLSGTNIDFCSGTRSRWFKSGYLACTLLRTTAYNCSNLYPSQCEISRISVPEAPYNQSSPSDFPPPTNAPVDAPYNQSSPSYGYPIAAPYNHSSPSKAPVDPPYNQSSPSDFPPPMKAPVDAPYNQSSPPYGYPIEAPYNQSSPWSYNPITAPASPSHEPIPDYASVAIIMEPSWSNETFAHVLCSAVDSHTLKVKLSATSGIGPRYLLPDCFYLNSSSVIDIDFTYVIIRGNSTFPNPMSRLAAAISQTPLSFVLYDCSSLTSLGSPATIPTFPTVIPRLQLSSCGLTGSLPTRLFKNGAQTNESFVLNLNGNDLTGSIPSTFLSGVDLSTVHDNIYLALEWNRLSGDFPSNLFAGYLPSANSITVLLRENSFTGPLNDIFAASSFNVWLNSFAVDARSNNFDGVTPTWIHMMPRLSTYRLNCDGCMLESMAGSPFAVSSTPGQTDIVVSLKNNKIVGHVSSLFFTIPHSPKSFDLRMPYNHLTSLADDLFEESNWTATASVIIDLGFNQLTGNVPSVAGQFGSSRIYYWIAMNSNPEMAGTLPPSFLSSICANATSSTNSEIALVIYSTRLTGPLTMPNYSSTPLTSLTVITMNADFTTLVVPNTTSGILSLTIYNNPRLTGALPSSFFLDNPRLVTLNADNTQLNGVMPNMGAINSGSMETLRLSGTNIDFCSGTRSRWFINGYLNCALLHTSAYKCPNLYPSQCDISMPEPPSAPVPVASVPVDLPVPISAPVVAPIAPTDAPVISVPESQVTPVSVTPTTAPAVAPTAGPATSQPTTSISTPSGAANLVISLAGSALLVALTICLL